MVGDKKKCQRKNSLWTLACHRSPMIDPMIVKVPSYPAIKLCHPVGYRHQDQIPVILVQTTFMTFKLNIISLIKNTHVMILMHSIAVQVNFKVEFSFKHLNFTLISVKIRRFLKILFFEIFENQMVQWYFCANYESVNHRKLNECYRSKNRWMKLMNVAIILAIIELAWF